MIINSSWYYFQSRKDLQDWETLSYNPFTLINHICYKPVIKLLWRKQSENQCQICLTRSSCPPLILYSLWTRIWNNDASKVPSPLADGRSHKARAVNRKSMVVSSFIAFYIIAGEKKRGICLLVLRVPIFQFDAPCPCPPQRMLTSTRLVLEVSKVLSRFQEREDVSLCPLISPQSLFFNAFGADSWGLAGKGH